MVDVAAVVAAAAVVVVLVMVVVAFHGLVKPDRREWSVASVVVRRSYHIFLSRADTHIPTRLSGGNVSTILDK